MTNGPPVVHTIDLHLKIASTSLICKGGRSHGLSAAQPLPHSLSTYLLPAARSFLLSPSSRTAFTLHLNPLSLTVPHSPSSLFRTCHGEGAGVFAATPVHALSGRARPWWAAVAQAEAQKAGAHLGDLEVRLPKHQGVAAPAIMAPCSATPSPPLRWRGPQVSGCAQGRAQY